RVAPWAISLISASYCGGYADSDLDVISDEMESQSKPGLLNSEKGAQSANHSRNNSAEYASMDIVDKAPAADIAQAVIASNSADRDDDMLAIADADLFEYDRRKPDEETIQIKSEPMFGLAAGDEYRYTKYLAPDEQRLLGSELSRRSSESRTDNVVIISDSESQVSRISADSGTNVAHPGHDDNVSRSPAPEAAAAEKPRKRIAPMLVTAEPLETPSGNIIDQYGAVELEDDAGPSAPLLSIEDTHSRVQELFPHAVSQSQAAGWWRVRPDFDSVTLPHLQVMEQLGDNGDTFWFWRPSRLRIGATDMQQGCVQDLHLQSRMLQTQVQYRQSIVESDGIASAPAAAATITYDGDDEVLPLYGESSDEAELSDGLLREVEQERKEIAQRKEKAADTEQRRVAMVKEVIQEMVAHYVRMWHEKVQPRMERRAHGLWGKYIGRRQMLLAELSNLHDR
ncbi:hypothetical protein H4R20_004804, partial [Coemansia guatemalensis]